MKILIISQYYYPEQFQINEIAPELVRRGHEVTVVSGLPNYPKGVIYEGYENRFEEEIDGVKVIRCKNAPRGHNPIQLIRNYYSFAKNSKKVVRFFKGDFDVVLGYQLSPISSMLAALEYKQLYGTPVVFYTLDIWPVSAEAMLHGKNNPIYWWIKKLSKKIYQGADKILVTSRPFIDYLNRTLAIPIDRMAYLPQHAGTDMLDMDLEADNNGIADFMFAGNIGKGQRIDVIIKAAIVLGARKDYKIHIVGDGRMRQELEQMVIENGLEGNVVFDGVDYHPGKLWNKELEKWSHGFRPADNPNTQEIMADRQKLEEVLRSQLGNGGYTTVGRFACGSQLTYYSARKLLNEWCQGDNPKLLKTKRGQEYIYTEI